MPLKSDLLIGFEFEFIAPFDKLVLKKKAKQDLGISFIGSKFNKWKLVWDASVELKRKKNYFSHELISPPLPFYEALQALHNVFVWMQENGCKTNNTCGLHVNVSFKDVIYNKKINIVKLGLLYPEIEILKTFNRSRNHYCSSQIKYLRKYRLTPYEKSQMTSITAIEEFFISKMRIGSHKFHAMNLLKWKRNFNKYIEFRSIGNTDYEYKEKDIKKFIDAIARAMLSCVSKTSRKKDYIDKLYALTTSSH
jgi:hypothetical protein